MNRQRLVMVGIFLLALVLRCLALESRPLAYDDAFSFFLAQQPINNIIAGTAADTMPPLYYFLLHLWMLFSQSIWFMRFLSVILNLAAIWILFLLVKQLAGRKAAMWATFLAAISPLHIYHAQDMRMYALVELCHIAYLYFFVRIWLTFRSKSHHRLYWIGLVVSGTLAMYSHNLAIFGLIIPNFFLLIRREWRLLGRLIFAQVGIGLLAIPWLIFLPGQIAKVQQAFWTPKPGAVEIVQALILTAANLPMPDTLWLVGMVGSLLAFALVCFESFRARKGEAREGIRFLVIAMTVVPFLLLMVSYFMRPVFVPRQFLISMFAYLGLAGIVISRIKRQAIRSLILVCFLAGCLASLPFHYAFQEFPRSPTLQTMEYLRSEFRPGDVIIHDNKLSFFPARFYAPDLDQIFLPDEPGSPNDTLAPATQEAMGIYPAEELDTAVAGKQRIFFVVYQVTQEEYKRVNLDHPQLKWLRDNYRQIDYKFFNDLDVFLFE